MARLANRPRGEAELRQHLLDEAIEFRRSFGRLSPAAWAELSKPVDQLSAGEPYLINRWEIPGWHPASHAGNPNDFLILLADDELRDEAAAPW